MILWIKKTGEYFLYYKEKKDRKLYERIENKEYKIIKILKDDQRSYVALIEIDEERLVYKHPIEKNSRKWQRFLLYLEEVKVGENFKI